MPNPAEKVAQKGMGAVKAAKATFEGLSGVFRKLSQEHGEVTALLLRVKGSSDPKVRAEHWPVIRKELLAHEKGELQVVFPLFKQHPELQQIEAQHAQEASEEQKLIQQLDTLNVQDVTWQTTFDALVDIVQRHALEEENEFFPLAQRVLGDEQVDALKERYLETKQGLLAQLEN